MICCIKRCTLYILADLFGSKCTWVLVFHIVNYWGLHCVPILEPQTLNGNINVSGIVLVQYPCLSPAYSPVQRLDALCRTCADDVRLDWIYTLQLILQLQHTPLRSFHHKVVSVCQTRGFPFSCCGTDFLKCAPARLILSSSPIFQLLRFHELLGHPSRSSSPSSNFRRTHLGLLHQFSNCSNLIDLQLIRLSFTAGEHSYR